MRILYLHQYFKTPEEGGAIRSWYVASTLAQSGHEVELITAHNSTTYKTTVIQGFKVHYLPVSYHNSMGKSQRILAFALFFIRATVLGLRLKKFDKTFATSTPLTIGLIAMIIKWFRGTPYIFEVRDLWPEAPIQLGFIKNKMAIAILKKLEFQIYSRAETIVALSPGIAQGIAQVIDHPKIILVPNMADTETYGPKYDSNHKKLTIGYFGAMGFSNHLEYLISVAKKCQENRLEIEFILAGDGSEKDRLIRLIENEKLHNIQILSYLSKSEVISFMSKTDAVYISFGPFPVLETNSPNKFFDGLAAGKAIITNTKGWTKELVETYACGFYHDPERPNDFLEKINRWLEDKTLLTQSQANARKLAEEKFAKKVLTEQLVNLFG